MTSSSPPKARQNIEEVQVVRPSSVLPEASFRLPRALEIVFGLSILLQLIAPFTTHSYGTDGPSQIYFIDSFRRLVEAGCWIPRWIPNGFSNLGSPTFYFYPPITGYLATIIHFVTHLHNPEHLYQATGLVTTIISYLTARKLFTKLRAGRYQAVAGALFYAFAPFQLAELYSRSSLSSHVGFMFLPIVALGVVRIYNGRERAGIVMTAFGIAAVCLTNIPLTLLTALSLVAVLLAHRRKLTPRILVSLGIAAILTMGLTAYHLVSIIEYRKFVQLDNLYRDPDFLILDIIGLRNLNALYYDVGIYAIVIALAWVFWRRGKQFAELTIKERNILSASLAVSVLVFFLQLPITLPLWRHVIILQLIQGTWRFYILIVLSGAAAIALATTQRLWRATNVYLWICSITAIPPIILIIFNLHLGPHMDPERTDPKEYAPRQALLWSEVKVHSNDPFITPTRSLSAGEQIRIERTAFDRQDISIKLLQPTAIVLRRFDWPAWHTYARGKELATGHDSIGRATLVLGSGEYTVSMKLEKSPAEKAGQWVTGSTLAFGIIASCMRLAKKRQSKSVT